MNTLNKSRYVWSIIKVLIFVFFLWFLIGWYGFQAPRRENVVRGGATGGRSRMRRRPAAGGASTSSAATAEGLWLVKNVKLIWLFENLTNLLIWWHMGLSCYSCEICVWNVERRIYDILRIDFFWCCYFCQLVGLF